MKPLLVTTVTLRAGWSAAFARTPGGAVARYPDEARSDCSLPDAVSPARSVYAVRENAAGETSVQFRSR